MRGNTPYYDDENMMSIVDYSTPRSSEDLNNPNSNRATVITNDSPRSQVVEEHVEIIERFGPFFLDRDSTFSAINLIEAGEVVSIELVTDNPYVGLYIELDDFKMKEPNGMTASELILRGRTDPTRRNFYAEDRRPDGSYVLKYSPERVDEYKDRIKIEIRNDIMRPKNIRGFVRTFKSRSSLPTPTELGFLGGSFIKCPQIKGVLEASTNYDDILARGLNFEPYDSHMPNDSVRDDPLLFVGASNPFVGFAGKAIHNTVEVRASGDSNCRAVFGEPGVQLTSTTGANTPSIYSWPGQRTNSGESEQQILIYATVAESESVVFPSSKGPTAAASLTVGNALYLRDGDTIYYPGEITAAKYYDDGTSQFQDVGDGSGVTTSDGAFLLTVKPGLNFTPKKFDIVNTDGTSGIGTISNPSGQVIIHELIVHRRKKRSLVG